MPVELSVLIAFSIASVVLLVVPGPTIIMVVAQSLAHGRTYALSAVAGVALGDLIAASLSIAGVGTLLAASSFWFTVVKALGAIYLIYLGVKMWKGRAHGLEPDKEETDLRGVGAWSIFRDAFLVTLFNPKGIIFFMAFVPQFIDPTRTFAPQATVFVAVFVVLGALNAFLYAVLADSARRFVCQPSTLNVIGRAGGSLLIGAGVFSLFAKRA